MKDEKICCHKDTYILPDTWPTGEDIEVCNCCGMSRAHWERGESLWAQVDLYKARVELQAILEKLD